MISNRDIKKYWEINILLDILSGDFMSYVAKNRDFMSGDFFTGYLFGYLNFAKRCSLFFQASRAVSLFYSAWSEKELLLRKK